MSGYGREELVQNIKDCGQSLIDNAENIVGNYKYLGEITITCFPNDCNEAAHIEITNDIYPEKYLERHM